jgi:V/A-type H+-transporting ATPase subunit D
MAIMNVNPTRMELKRLKKRLETAQRGHKLLKDKRDELMKQFLEIVKENRILRTEVEERIAKANKNFLLARASLSSEAIETAILYPLQTASLSVSTKNIMSVNVPRFTFELSNSDQSAIYPYGFAATSSELDAAIKNLSRVFERMLELAESEKSAQLLAQEIERTRRRVNALEYVMIPDLRDTIKSITMKLEENERGNITRLMKVKDMMIKEQIEHHWAEEIQ